MTFHDDDYIHEKWQLLPEWTTVRRTRTRMTRTGALESVPYYVVSNTRTHMHLNENLVYKYKHSPEKDRTNEWLAIDD